MHIEMKGKDTASYVTQVNCSKSKQTRGQPLGRGHNTAEKH